jgi:hypothetical protein
MQCNACGRKPILQRQQGTTPSFMYACICKERGVNGPSKESARYGWKRRRQIREARLYLRSKVRQSNLLACPVETMGQAGLAVEEEV